MPGMESAVYDPDVKDFNISAAVIREKIESKIRETCLSEAGATKEDSVLGTRVTFNTRAIIEFGIKDIRAIKMVSGNAPENAADVGLLSYKPVFAWKEGDTLYLKPEGNRVFLDPYSSFLLSGFSSLKDISFFKYADASAVTDMSGMFFDCKSLKDLTPIKDWDVRNAVDMSYMFSYCSDLEDVFPLMGWNIESAEDLSWMFMESGIKSAEPLKYWNIYGKERDIAGMFEGTKTVNRPGRKDAPGPVRRGSL